MQSEKLLSVKELSADCSSAVRLCHPWELPNARILPLCGSGHSAAQDIGSLGRFDDRGSRINQGRTRPNREVISGQFLSELPGVAYGFQRLDSGRDSLQQDGEILFAS